MKRTKPNKTPTNQLKPSPVNNTATAPQSNRKEKESGNELNWVLLARMNDMYFMPVFGCSRSPN